MKESFTTIALNIVAVTQTPYIINDEGTYKSETNLSIDSKDMTYNAWVEIDVRSKTKYMESLGTINKGLNTKTVHVVELNEEGESVTFRIFDNPIGAGTPLASITLVQKKVRHWTVYVSHSTHIDFGYTDYQEHLRNTKWPGHIDAAMKFIEDTDSWSENEKFRHHIESSYLLYGSAFNVRNADWVQNIKTQLEKNRLMYSASCMNTSMEVMSTEQLVRYYYYSARLLKDMLGADSSGIAMMVDNPSISWSNVDIMADAGVKFMYLGPNFNPNTPLTLTEAYPRLFYMAGRKPNNKILLISGNLYNLDEMQFVYDGPNATPVPLEVTVKCTGDVLMNVYHRDNYPCDAVLQMVDQYWDNGPLFPQVMERVKEMSSRVDEQGRPYVYPKFINSNMKDFTELIENKYSSAIPTFTGTYENWWCFGSPSDAYSGAQIRYAHDLVPAAEIFSTIANHSGNHVRYPYVKISDAYNYMMLYDEHTFAPSVPIVGDQHFWKRNNAISSKNIAENVMDNALTAISTLIPTSGKTITVFNPLSWDRSDITCVKLSELPLYFDIVDMETLAEVKYQKLKDGNVEFLAANVPGLGYKCFKVKERADEPIFTSNIKKTINTLENNYFKVTIGSQGEITSILDKLNGNIELVDSTSPYKMNEFVYMISDVHSFKVNSVSRINNSSVEIDTGAVQGRIIFKGICEGTAGIERNVILYDSVPRIDIVNVVNKTDALAWRKQDEEGYFTFPLNVPDFELRHEMPTGDVKPYVDPKHADPTKDSSDIEQFYTSSTDFYTVNRWIDASSKTGNYGITMTTMSAPIVQYGERRSILYDIDYNTKKPWVYSYVLNNKWATNFIDTQPGLLTFKYSIKPHSGNNWRDGRADHFGWGTSVPLFSKIIDGPQAGTGYKTDKGQWIEIDVDNVIMTTAKPAEANSEGMILRFNETKGKDTSVTVNLSYFEPSGVTETDLMENDRAPMTLANGKVTFNINGYGWKTIRVKFGIAPEKITGVSAVMDTDGTLISWNCDNDKKLAFYEVFRDTVNSFTPGTGNYLGSTTVESFYDKQLTEGLSRNYYYKVRAVRSGLKGIPSEAVQPQSGSNIDHEPPTAPSELKAGYIAGNRVAISWIASTDNLYVKGYKVYRNGAEIVDLAVIMNSYLDINVTPGKSYSYFVKAYDKAGNLSEKSNEITVATERGMIKPGNIAPYAAVFASSQFSEDYPATAVNDGYVGVTGEWASSGEVTPWIQLTWEEVHTVNRILLYDRDADVDHIKEGVLYFSDGSYIKVDGFPSDKRANIIEFPDKTITWVKFQVTKARGYNVGLSEIEVY